jgi:hypothetical protein
MKLAKKMFFKLICQTVDVLAKVIYITCQPKEPEIPLLPSAIKESDIVAIVALYQNGMLCPNAESMLKILKEKGVTLFVINNGKLCFEEQKKLSFVDFYYERLNWGMDFGAYKLGTRIIRAIEAEHKIHPKKYLFLNDSILILNARYSAFMDQFLADSGDWVGVTESQQGSHHVSSWLFSVSEEVWKQPKFSAFWNKYKPLASRPYTIVKGEIGLSTLLKKMGYNASMHFPSSLFMGEVMKLTSQEFNSALSLVQQKILPSPASGSSLKRADWILAYLKYEKDLNQTHFWQLFALWKTDFPFVKKDLWSRSRVTREQFELLLQLVPKDIHEEVVRIFRRLLVMRQTRTLPWGEKVRVKTGLKLK